MQIFLNGLLQGIFFGSIGVAFALVYSTTKVFHLALGGIGAIAPYLVLACLGIGLPDSVAVALAILAALLLGILIEQFVHWPLSAKQAPSEVHLIASLGFYLVLTQIIAIVWGSETKTLRDGMDSVWTVFEMTLAKAQVLGPVVVLLITGGFFLWLNKANRGLELRALADNPTLVALLGRNVRALRYSVFALSAAFAAIVEIAQAYDIGFDPYGGLKAVLLGMVAMVIGGTGNFIAPFVGGVLLGIIRSEVIWYGSARWEEAVTFVFLAFFLFFRPQGLLARKTRLEESA